MTQNNAADRISPATTGREEEMFTLTTLGIACFALGLYAGKRREKGLSWYNIACEFANSVWNMVATAFDVVSKPFRKGKEDTPETPAND